METWDPGWDQEVSDRHCPPPPLFSTGDWTMQESWTHAMETEVDMQKVTALSHWGPNIEYPSGDNNFALGPNHHQQYHDVIALPKHLQEGRPTLDLTHVTWRSLFPWNNFIIHVIYCIYIYTHHCDPGSVREIMMAVNHTLVTNQQHK